MNLLSQIAICMGAFCYAGFLVLFLIQEVPLLIKQKDTIGIFLVGLMLSISLFGFGMALS